MHISTSSIIGLLALASATNAISFPNPHGNLAVRAAPNGGKQGGSQPNGAGQKSGGAVPASGGRPAGSQGGGKSTANAPNGGGKGAGSPADVGAKPASGGAPDQGQGRGAGSPGSGGSPPAARPSPAGGWPVAPSQGNNRPAAQSPRESPKPTQSPGKDSNSGSPMNQGRQQGVAHNGATDAVGPGAGGFGGGFPSGFNSFPHPSGGAPDFPHPSSFPNIPKPTPAIPVPAAPSPPATSPAAGSCPQIWFKISQDLKGAFTSGAPDGQCNDLARGAVRAAFHDCGSWDQSLGTSAGCDGSLYLAKEYTRSENAGLEQIVPQLGAMAQSYGVGVADFLQFAGAHATVTCPLGPTVKTFVGRKDRSTPNPEGLLPNPHTDADTLLQNMGDKGFSPAELAALLGAHSTAKQFEFDPAHAGAPLDDTPGIWDVRFYAEVLDNDAPFILQSDKVLAVDSRVEPTWKSFVNNQAGWDEAFSVTMTKMSLMGVEQTGLVDCTAALPPPQDNFQEPAGLMSIPPVPQKYRRYH